MKTIIAGGRDYKLTDVDRKRLDELGITMVISGGATGADAGGEAWAKASGIHVEVVPAEWSKYGRSAGPRRNQAMALRAEACVLFPGGRGTASMRSIAMSAGLYLYDLSTEVSA